ncbi:MAG: hypothetical protein HYW26_00765 [Candidatus Aenigmarchaeota archaeon]|nr:hypothetical protein [Candidatus Aenigmarchaeota archaeon]
MAYKVGISTGFWNIGKDPSLLGLAQKAGGLGATGGIRFTQLDLETISEFLEPRLKENMKRMQKDLGLEIGLHGEISQMGAFESAERKTWEQVHSRMVETVKRSAELGFKYINYHYSASIILQQEEARIRPFGFSYHVVTPTGEPFPVLCDKSKAAKEYVMRMMEINALGRHIMSEKPYQELAEKKWEEIRRKYAERIKKAIEALRRNPEYQRLHPELQRQQEEKINQEFSAAAQNEQERETRGSRDFFYEAWKKSPYTRYVLEGGEIDAYMVVAHSMKEAGDPLWTSIVGNLTPEEAYNDKPLQFNAAVAAKYIEGHFAAVKNKDLDGKTVKDFVGDKELYILFENPEAGAGQEGLYRFFNPLEFYHLIKKISSPYFKMTIDFEHMLTQRIDPDKLVKDAPEDFGKQIKMLHLGEPKPYHPAHIPIPLGSQAQEVLYKWIFAFRKKGFSDGYLIFERGAGRRPGDQSAFNVFEHSIWVLRQISKFLDNDTEPDQLPPEFFGMSFDNKDIWARQLVTIREHAWDPLHDVLAIPEEKHTFLGGEAVRKGKAQEWEKRKFR